MDSVFVVGLVLLDAAFLFLYYQHSQEYAVETVAQPIPMILISIGLVISLFDDFSRISVLLLSIMILLAFLINYTKLQQGTKAMIFTLWQTLCIASIILIVLMIIISTTDSNKRKKKKNYKY